MTSMFTVSRFFGVARPMALGKKASWRLPRLACTWTMRRFAASRPMYSAFFYAALRSRM